MPQHSIAMMQNFPHEIEHDTTFLFTSESVGEGHPGKCFDRINSMLFIAITVASLVTCRGCFCRRNYSRLSTLLSWYNLLLLNLGKVDDRQDGLEADLDKHVHHCIAVTLKSLTTLLTTNQFAKPVSSSSPKPVSDSDDKSITLGSLHRANITAVLAVRGRAVAITWISAEFEVQLR